MLNRSRPDGMARDSGEDDEEDGANHSSDDEPNEQRVLLPIQGENRSKVLELAADLSQDADAELYVMMAVDVPEQTPLELPKTEHAHREVAKRIMELSTEDDEPQAHGLVRVGHGKEAIVQRVLEQYGIETVILEEPAHRSVLETISSTDLDRFSVPSDVNVVSVSGLLNLTQIDSILVPVGSGPHSMFAVEVAHTLGAHHNASITVLHVLPDPATERDRTEGKAILENAAGILDGYDDFTTELKQAAPEIPEAIIKESKGYDLTVLGAPQKGRLREFVFGSTTSAVREHADGTVLTVRQRADREGGESSSATD